MMTTPKLVSKPMISPRHPSKPDLCTFFTNFSPTLTGNRVILCLDVRERDTAAWFLLMRAMADIHD